MIELSGRLIVYAAPGSAAVCRNGPTAVVPFEDDLWIARVDPDDVVVAVRHFDRRESLSAIFRFVHPIDFRRVRDLRIRRVDEDRHIVKRALTQFPLRVHALPGCAGIVRPEDSAVARLNDRVNDARIARCDGNADLSEDAGRKPGILRDLRPMRAAVERLVEAAAGAAAGQLPRLALCLPHRSVEHVAIARVHDQVDAARILVDEEHFLPRRAAVGRLKNAALRVGLEDVSHRCGIDDIGIAGIDHQLGDHVRLTQPRVRPRFSGVGRLVDPVPGVEVAANVGLAGAGVDDAGIRRCDRQRADRIGDSRNLAVGDVRPFQAVIGAAPDAAFDATEIEEVLVAGNAGYGDGASTDVRADAAPTQLAR